MVLVCVNECILCGVPSLTDCDSALGRALLHSDAYFESTLFKRWRVAFFFNYLIVTVYIIPCRFESAIELK